MPSRVTPSANDRRAQSRRSRLAKESSVLVECLEHQFGSQCAAVLLLWLATEDISNHTRWEIEHDCHTLIVHLHGEMQRLETRVGRAPVCREPARIGEMWLIPAGRPYLGRALGDSISYAEYHFEREWLDALAQPGTKGATVRPRMQFRDPLLHGLTGRLVQLADEADDIAGLLRESIAQTVALQLLQRCTLEGRLVDEQPVSLAAQVRRRIEEHVLAHLDQQISLAELAQVAELPPQRLIRAFRNSFGQTPLQYVISQRLQLACRLLESTRMDISAIALATGFSSHSHLAHAFKQRYRLSPRQYRSGAR